MKLERISISNFKGIRAQIFEPTKFSCLVGENNAGKSTVMQAVVYALNRPTQLPSSHFYDPAAPVTFELRFSGVDGGHIARLAEEARQKIAALVIDGVLCLQIKYALGEKVAVTVLRRVPIEGRYQSDAIEDAFAGKRGQGAIEQVVAEVYPEFKAAQPEPLKTIAAGKSFINAQVAELGEAQFELSYAPLPTGIGPSIAPLLPEPIYIPAVKNLNDDLKTTQSTSFGRLLGLLLEEQGIATRPLLFLFEEPELYLHPRSQRVLFGTLARISKTHQVVVTTHSPMFFEPRVTASFVRVAKRPHAPKPVAMLYPVNFELNANEAETFRLARFEHADAAFFSQGVILFEGESDDAYCRHVAKLLDA
ncbi:MAG: DUF2813 domain-containing protein, partial [Alcaligenaceae bacterium]